VSGARHQALGLGAVAARDGSAARRATPARRAAAPRSDTSWMSDGACNGKDPALWQPIGESSVFADQIQEARRICWRCPVFDSCREFSLETRQQSGIWAAMTERDREMELRRRTRARQRSGGAP
jgi:WhiB family transcriptional regulator, redox-sensing transcriptional regulator